MRVRKLLALTLAMVLVLGSFTFAFGADDTTNFVKVHGVPDAEDVFLEYDDCTTEGPLDKQGQHFNSNDDKLYISSSIAAIIVDDTRYDPASDYEGTEGGGTINYWLYGDTFDITKNVTNDTNDNTQFTVNYTYTEKSQGNTESYILHGTVQIQQGSYTEIPYYGPGTYEFEEVEKDGYTYISTNIDGTIEDTIEILNESKIPTLVTINNEKETYEMSITKSALQTNVQVGEEVVYTITVINTGNQDLNYVEVTDSILDYTTTVSIVEGGSFTDTLTTTYGSVGTKTNIAEANYEDIVVTDSAVVKVYDEQTILYNVTTFEMPTGSGITSGDGDYEAGDSVTVTAVATPGFVFVDWVDLSRTTPTSVSTDLEYGFTMPDNNVVLVANFTEVPEEYGTITFTKTVINVEGTDTTTFNVTVTYPNQSTTDIAIQNGQTVTLSGLELGTYEWEEDIPDGYQGVSNTTGTITLNLASAPIKTVEIVNEKFDENLGSITVYKEIIGEQVGDDFNFRLYKGDAVPSNPDDPEYIVAQTSVDINNPEFIGGLEAGWYTIGEDPDIEGYILPYPISFELDGGEDKSVTLQNIEIPLKITKTVDDDEVRTNENVTYTITVENTSDSINFDDVVVEDANLGYSTTLASLTAGGVFTHSITTSYGTEGNKVNTAKASTYYYHPELDNVRDGEGQYIEVQDSANVVVDDPSVPRTRTYRMTIDKVADGDFYEVGDTIEYTITVRNTGNSTLTNVLVTDDMTGLSETIDFLNPRASEEFKTTYVAQEDDIGDLTNTATAEDDRAGTEEATEIVTVEGSPEGVPEYLMTIEKTAVDDGNPIYFGDMVEFTIVETNTGDETLTNILVEDDMVDFEAVIQNLQPGKSKEFKVKVEAPNVPGPFKNTATASSTEIGTIESEDTVWIQDPPTPLDVPDTGVAPTDLFFGLGALVSGLGVFFTKKRKY